MEWGFLICATALLVVGEAYHSWTNLSAALLGISWIARRVRTGKFTRSTPIDVPISLFIISALVALWAAPNRQAGLVRLYLLLATVTIFYALVNSDLRSLKIFSSVFIAFAGAMGVFLTSQYDWAGSPARFQITKEAGIWLNHVVPNLELNLPHWNVIRNIMASLLAVSLPVALPGLLARKSRNSSAEEGTELPRRNSASISYWAASSLILIIFSLILTESRTPWMVFGLIFALSGWWWLSGRINLKFPFSRIYTFLIGLGGVLTLTGMLVMRQPQLLSTISRMPGPKDYLGRGEIYSQSWRLAQDTPFTGGGLAAFPALYSTYIRVIPFNAFLNEDTGNSAYLNLLVEQGWLGVLSYIVLLLVALGVAAGRYSRVKAEHKSFVIAGMLGLGFILLQGSVHATLVASRAIPALLIPAGLALSGTEDNQLTFNSDGWKDSPTVLRSRQSGRTWKVASVVALLIAASVLVFVFRSGLLSAWYANLGAVYMSQTELADFPSGGWDDGSRVSEIVPAETLFNQALQYNPADFTAHHRLGLIAMTRRDFPTALAQLEKAHGLDPSHRGVRKSLGYTYVWDGRLEQGTHLLMDIPEAKQELSVYVWWWSTQSRPDLSGRARMAYALLVDQQ
jgi:tetratricopeptide (TPR) repeat protein